MYNNGIIFANLNEYSILENIRDNRTSNPLLDPAAPREQQGDVVDISQQAFQLFRTENQSQERVNQSTGAETAALEQEPQQSPVELPEQTNNGIPTYNEDTYTNFNSQPTGIEGLENNTISGTEAAQAPLSQTLNNPTIEEDYLNNLSNTTVTDTLRSTENTPSTVEGTVIYENQSSLRSEAPVDETLSTPTPATESSPISQTTGYPNGGITTDSTATETDRDVLVAQYQEQAILQAVGTQLAQSVPPSNIFPLIG